MSKRELCVAVAVFAALAFCTTAHVRASCAAPILSLDHASGPAGDVVEIRGQYFGTGCNDVEVSGTFAGPPLGEPQTGITLVIVQDDVAIPLGVIDADGNYEFAVRLAIPTRLHVGEATIRVDGSPTAAGAVALFTITSERPNPGTAPTTTVLLGTTSTSSPASTDSTPGSIAPLGVGDPGPQQPSDDSNRWSPWALGAIGFVVLIALAAIARSRLRTTQRIT